MRSSTLRWWSLLLALVLVAAACGDSDDGGDESGGETTATTAAGDESGDADADAGDGDADADADADAGDADAGDADTGDGDAGGDGVAEAAARVETFRQAQGALPVSEPLAALPSRQTAAYIQCGVAACEEIRVGVESAAAELGMELEIFNHDDTPENVASAWQAAVDAGRVHHQWLPDVLYYEDNGFSLDSLNGLRSMGHALEARNQQGAAEVIVVGEGGVLEGGVDLRVPDGGAIGY